MGKVSIERIEHLGWKNCVKISNGTVDLIVTTDVGPRIIYYGFKGGPNHMKVYEDMAGKTDSDEWNIYGGHRFWLSPEEKPRTYEPDNFPCAWEKRDNGIKIRPPLNDFTGVEKEMTITLSEDGTGVQIDHKATNKNAWDIKFAVWALTVSAQGGRLIIPQPVTGPELLANRNISYWTYTRLNDPRAHWLDRYILLDQDSKASYTDEPEHRRFPLVPFKIGLHVPDGWVGYANHGQLFVKRFDLIEGEEYPDFGHCSFEAYTNIEMLEIESLSPLKEISPGDFLEHTENWQLFDNVDKPTTEDEIDEKILPLLM